ncbi:uncharacterized protein LOC143500475 isoform X1 [Brachyhypopomus gauderio]|uniref:uncharacterized protein LOC143500475 isoform X1 n=1 Tax=Brachyhypopomus gauderio TaxID=698409 RepID=UPI0040428C7F
MPSSLQIPVLLIISGVMAVTGCFLPPSRLRGPQETWTRTFPDHRSNRQEEPSQSARLSASPRWRKSIVLCCICQDFVNRTRRKMDMTIQRKINVSCNKFIPKEKIKCQIRGQKLKLKFLNVLFPGPTARDACKKRAKLCLY